MLLAAACRGLPPGGSGVSPLSTSQARAGLEARRLAVSSFQLQGEISVKTSQGELNGDHLILGKFPDRLRAQVLGPFGRPLLTLVSDGRQLVVLDFDRNQAFVGPASRANVARFLGLGLSPAEAYALISGNVPISASAQGRLLETGRADRLLLKISRPTGDGTNSVLFDPQGFVVLDASLGESQGQARLTCRYQDFTPAGKHSYPRRLHISDDQGRSFRLFNEVLKVNLSLPETVFRLDLPAGIKVVPLP